MRTFTEDNATDVVLERLAECDDPRLKQVMTSVIRHLHAVVKEVEPSMAEWARAIDFLTRTGQICDDKRQEWILLSDTLGVSMLVDAINHRKPAGATESTVLGPFHVAGAPALPMGANIAQIDAGEPTFISGRVTDPDGNPIEGAELDVWQASEAGFYDVQQPDEQPEYNLRGRFRTGPDGRYWFRTVKPAPYPIPTDGPVGHMLDRLGRHPYRPAHVHFIVGAPGFEPVTTHLFVKGGDYLDSDAVFGVKDSLIVPFIRHDEPAAMAEMGVDRPFYTANYDFGLNRTADAQAAE
jgi:catechol 1,2-dioxygenase